MQERGCDGGVSVYEKLMLIEIYEKFPAAVGGERTLL